MSEDGFSQRRRGAKKGTEVRKCRVPFPASLPRLMAFRDPDGLWALIGEVERGKATEWHVHFGGGLWARDMIRKHADGWTDHDLDDDWPLVVLEAKKFFDSNGKLKAVKR